MHQSSIIQCAHVMGVPPGGETRTNPSHPNPPSLPPPYTLYHCWVAHVPVYPIMGVPPPAAMENQPNPSPIITPLCPSPQNQQLRPNSSYFFQLTLQRLVSCHLWWSLYTPDTESYQQSMISYFSGKKFKRFWAIFPMVYHKVLWLYSSQPSGISLRGTYFLKLTICL